MYNTVIFYDNKVSHIDSNVVTDGICDFDKHYVEILVTRWSLHDYLGVPFELWDYKKVQIDMKVHMKNT